MYAGIVIEMQYSWWWGWKERGRITLHCAQPEPILAELSKYHNSVTHRTLFYDYVGMVSNGGGNEGFPIPPENPKRVFPEYDMFGEPVNEKAKQAQSDDLPF